MPLFVIQQEIEEEDRQSQIRAIDHLTNLLRDQHMRKMMRPLDVWFLNELVSFARQMVGHYPEEGALLSISPMIPDSPREGDRAVMADVEMIYSDGEWVDLDDSPR
jgi:hypothetical protein